MSELPERVTCPDCKGDGLDRYLDYIDYMTPCPTCGGRGTIKGDVVDNG